MFGIFGAIKKSVKAAVIEGATEGFQAIATGGSGADAAATTAEAALAARLANPLQPVIVVLNQVPPAAAALPAAEAKPRGRKAKAEAGGE